MAELRAEAVVSPEQGNARLDAFIAEALPDISRSAAQRLIRDGVVAVNGIPALRPARRMTPGERVVVERPRGDSQETVASDIPFRVVYEDADLLVVDKPAGVAVHPGAGHVSDTLANGLLARYPDIAGVGDAGRPGIVHRLDRDTSGLMAVARSQAALQALQDLVRRRLVERRYLSLLWGAVTPEEGIVEAPIGRDPRRRQRQALVPGGRAARTRFRVVRRLADTTLVEATLDTGRMHQIRVHMKAIGFPVVGDRVYGRPGYGLRRQFLHAHYLAFDHPLTRRWLARRSPLPPDLARALAAAARA